VGRKRCLSKVDRGCYVGDVSGWPFFVSADVRKRPVKVLSSISGKVVDSKRDLESCGHGWLG
jgi:hypothetical protein